MANTPPTLTAQGVNWIEPDAMHKTGASSETADAVARGELYEPYTMPEPDPTGQYSFYEVVDDWIHDLSDLQVVSALYDFHERWTWETGNQSDLYILEQLENEFKTRKRQPGDMTYNTKDDCLYTFDGKQWVLVGGNSGIGQAGQNLVETDED